MACAPRDAGPTEDASARRDLGAAVAQYYRDMSARTWSAYAAHFWPQATLTTVWQPQGESAPRVVITSLEEFLSHTAEGPDSKPIFEERLLSQEARIVGDLAHVWAHYEVRFGDSASVATWRGVDAFTWMKHDGTWRIVALAYTDEPGQRRGAP
jgi:hypothetical protein